MAIRHRGHTHETVTEVRACEFAPKTETIPTPEKAEVVELPIERPLPDGEYTVETEDGLYLTLKLSHQAVDDTFMPGRQLIGYLVGPDNSHDYNNFGHVGEDSVLRVWRRFRGNDKLASFARFLIEASDEERDAMHSGRCGRCNRKLTVPASKSMGLGPVCAEKVGV